MLQILLSNSVYIWYTDIVDTDLTWDVLSLTLTLMQGHMRLGSLFVNFKHLRLALASMLYLTNLLSDSDCYLEI